MMVNGLQSSQQNKTNHVSSDGATLTTVIYMIHGLQLYNLACILVKTLFSVTITVYVHT